jgi:peptidoglycan/LPS O-acetylase OafA/YrhL
MSRCEEKPVLPSGYTCHMVKTGGSQPALNRATHILGMDGLRGIAAVTVIAGHVGSVLAAGVHQPGPLASLLAVMGQGLTLFFALSGFLLYKPFAQAVLSGERRPSTRRYFLNRALRIYPVYIFILLVVSLLLGASYNATLSPDQSLDRSSEPVGFMTSPFLLITNALLVHSLLPEAVRTGIGVSWTLTVELLFYVALPILGYLGYRLARGRPSKKIGSALLAPAIILAIGIAGKIVLSQVAQPTNAIESNYLSWGGNWTAVLSRSFFVHADLFCFGMAAAVISVAFQLGTWKSKFKSWVGWGAIAVGIGAVALLRGTIFENSGYGVAASALILFVALSNKPEGPGAAARLFEWAPFRNVGLISYSLYLWHLPVIWVLFQHGWRFPASVGGYWLNLVLVVAVAIGLSTLTYQFIEKPAMRFKKKSAPIALIQDLLAVNGRPLPNATANQSADNR